MDRDILCDRVRDGLKRAQLSGCGALKTMIWDDQREQLVGFIVDALLDPGPLQGAGDSFVITSDGIWHPQV